MRSPVQLIRRRVSERARRWALQRQGRDPPQLSLESRRIYILPTLPGLVFGMMLATMLAGAMNYNNNLAFALTFLLAATGIVAIYHTHRNLAGLRIHYLGADPVFAGDPLEVRFALLNDAERPRDEVFLHWAEGAEVAGGVPAGASRVVRLPLATRSRGPQPLPGLRLNCRAPLGLMRAWTWVHMEPRPLAYPRPVPVCRQPPGPSAPAGDAARRDLGDDDFAGLRAYQSGDSPRRIAWRHYARAGDLLVREYRGGGEDDLLWIDWDALPASDTETRIARLARLVIDAHESGRAWGLKTPGHKIAPGRGRDHLHRCLACLATTALPAGSDHGAG